MPDRRELSTAECEVLLRAGVAGRVAVSTPDGPHIVPVNYTVVGDAVVVRTSPYSLLGTYGRDSTVAFEIDEVEPARACGWSVQARGRLEVVADSDEIQAIRDEAEPQPWVGGARSLYLRIRWTELTGREVGERSSPSARMVR